MGSIIILTLITSWLDIVVLKLKGEILSWSLTGVQELRFNTSVQCCKFVS